VIGSGQRPDISIIIVSYNVRDLLENCLHSVESALEGLRGEVFVVDNDSDDGSADMTRQRFPDVRLIANSENMGFAKANNLALAHAQGEFLLLLNPDTLVQEDTLHTMLLFFRENDDVGMAGCKIIKPDGTLEAACRRSFPSPWVSFTKLTGLSTLFPRSPLFARYNLTYLSEDESYEVDAISGSFMMLRRAVYEQIGGLDETYFMYGEDLDWCFRVQRAEWKLFYVHSTKIVHYGGESTKRSSIDATAEFYKAMQVFAEKNLGLSRFSLAVISLGIKLRLLLSRSGFFFSDLREAAVDAVMMMLALIGAEVLRFGAPFQLPSYAYPTVFIVAVIVLLLSQLVIGTYTKRNYGIVRSALGVLLSFFVISTLTFFFKEWGFSRAINLISSAMAMAFIPGWRILHALFNPQHRINPVTGRRTLLVGLNEQSLDILERLRRAEERRYDIQGLIDINRRRIGRTIHGVVVLGSVENIGKVIRERRITDIILGPDVLSYADILSMINRTRGLNVQYRIVPKTMEFIIGKSSVDQLSSVPLLDVEYGLMRSGNRVLKRILDLLVSLPLTVFLSPALALFTKPSADGPLRRMLRQMPSVTAGRQSLVGHEAEREHELPPAWSGKPGLTGLAQLRGGPALSQEEMLGALLQYVRNYSVFLDIELLVRAVLRTITNKNARK
jgi:O-antigen biosynthesis protein